MDNHLQRIIEDFGRRKVLVVGDAIVDTYIRGTTDKLCREAPVPVLNVQEQEHSCGGAANTAINVAALGADTYFLTVTGRDENAKHLTGLLRKYKVHTHCMLRDVQRTTIAKKRVTAANNILLRLDEGQTGPISGKTEEAVREKIAKLYPHVDAIILSDYGYGVLTEGVLQTIEELQKQQPKALIIDSRDLPKFRRLKPTAVKPNYEESLQLLHLGKAEPEERINQVISHSKKLLELTGARCVAATMDVDGALIFEKGKQPHRILAVPRDNKNSIGAGDTFISAMTLGLACGAEAKMAAELGAAAAAVIMQKEGTTVCTNAELQACFAENPKQVQSLNWLKEKAQEWKKTGKRIVFTNGCFDILHIGHVNLLNRAKALGDILVVGINSDDSIRRVKGDDRPINQLDDRITVLSALHCVDYLIPFDEDTALKLVQAIAPDYFVKGANYQVQTLPEASLVVQLGGQVKILPLFSDNSTAKLIQKIRDAGTSVSLSRQTSRTFV